ncbi:hypothetical protein CPB86DRAFT_800886 [Serendipita vermifera]|nr:hypothetical protein CPB86DRAFT_800886 [Serendipita vermifera]
MGNGTSTPQQRYNSAKRSLVWALASLVVDGLITYFTAGPAAILSFGLAFQISTIGYYGTKMALSYRELRNQGHVPALPTPEEFAIAAAKCAAVGTVGIVVRKLCERIPLRWLEGFFDWLHGILERFIPNMRGKKTVLSLVDKNEIPQLIGQFSRLIFTSLIK